MPPSMYWIRSRSSNLMRSSEPKLFDSQKRADNTSFSTSILAITCGMEAFFSLRQPAMSIIFRSDDVELTVSSTNASWDLSTSASNFKAEMSVIAFLNKGEILPFIAITSPRVKQTIASGVAYVSTAFS